MPPTYVDDGLIVLEAAQNLKPAQLPLAALRRIDGTDLEAPVYRGGVVVDELEGALCRVSTIAVSKWASKEWLVATAMPLRPHFIVSGLRLFLRTCQRSGTTRSVAM